VAGLISTIKTKIGCFKPDPTKPSASKEDFVKKRTRSANSAEAAEVGKEEPEKTLQ
jgi:hypothetical protein